MYIGTQDIHKKGLEKSFSDEQLLEVPWYKKNTGLTKKNQ